jgi:2',3'-cyclic-nucleotide 2'-phosphodiesterase (5'-nucleotidase family)
LNQKDANSNYIIPSNSWAQQRLNELNVKINDIKSQVVGNTAVALDGTRENVRTKITDAICR